MELALVIAKSLLGIGAFVTIMLHYTAPAQAVVKRSICVFCKDALLMVLFALTAGEFAHRGDSASSVLMLLACAACLFSVVAAYVRAVRPKEVVAAQKPGSHASVPQG
jgi:hypothetical protein